MTQRKSDLDRLLVYVQLAKKEAAVAGHQGHSAEDDSYHMGRAAAFQQIENLIRKKLTQQIGKTVSTPGNSPAEITANQLSECSG